MIFIIGFIILVILLFKHFYFTNTLEKCRSNTEDGVTYKDCFGKTRMLRNDRIVHYEKKQDGRILLCYSDGHPIDYNNFIEDQARFQGEEYAWYDRRNGIDFYKVLDTGEVYAIVDFNYHRYYIEYNEDKPMRIVRETTTSKNDISITSKYKEINIDEMNIVLEDMFIKHVIINYRYFNYAMWRYMSLKWINYAELMVGQEIKWQKFITKENINTLVADPNNKWQY